MDCEAIRLIDQALDTMDRMGTLAIEQIELYENKENKTAEERRFLASLYYVQMKIGNDENRVFHDYIHLRYLGLPWTADDYRKLAEVFATITKYF